MWDQSIHRSPEEVSECCGRDSGGADGSRSALKVKQYGQTSIPIGVGDLLRDNACC